MPLLNYTTKVPARQSVTQVHDLLVKAGARSVLADYNDNAEPVALAFVLQTPLGLRSFRLPADIDAVERVLRKVSQSNMRTAVFRSRDHAARVAWRILKDWVEAQVAILQTEMVAFDQVMLPYMQADDGRTVYELYRDQQLSLPRAE